MRRNSMTWVGFFLLLGVLGCKDNHDIADPSQSIEERINASRPYSLISIKETSTGTTTIFGWADGGPSGYLLFTDAYASDGFLVIETPAGRKSVNLAAAANIKIEKTGTEVAPALFLETEAPAIVAPDHVITFPVNRYVEVPLLGGTLIATDVQDSRCPVDATCVWEGVGIVSFKYRNLEGVETTFSLATSPDTARVRSFGVVTLKLDDLSPYPSLAYPSSLDLYRVRLYVSLTKGL